MKSIQIFIKENKHLLIPGGITFLLIYLSSFIKGYGYFIDEFYYIACANNPAFGYVDHPPLAPLVLTVFQFIFGSSLYAIRIVPALAASASVFFTGVMAREIGGGRHAQILSACAMAAAPMVIAFGGFYSMNVFEPLLALIILYYTVKMIKENDPRRWIPIGIVMGLGMMNKHTFALFILVLGFSLLVTGKWRLLYNRWFVFGSICGILIFIPNLVWQAMNDYPSIEFYRNISTKKNMYTPPMSFLMGQIVYMSPSNVIIWSSGFIFLLVSKRMRDFRFLSVLFISLFLFMMFTGTSRPDRLTFAYPAVLAGGAVFLEYLFARIRMRWLTGITIGSLAFGLAIALPIILPYFDYETVRMYVERIGLNTEIERGKKPPLPQLVADRIGWEEKYALVLKAYKALPDSDKKEAVIAAGNYGQAGAFELFGKKDSLCPVVSSHNNYFFWSRGRLKGNVILFVTQKRDTGKLNEMFETVLPQEGEFSSPYVSFHENNLKVFVCRNPKMPPLEMLERGKHFY